MAFAIHSRNIVGPWNRGPSILVQAGDEPALAIHLANPVLHALLAKDRRASQDLFHGLAGISLTPRRPTRGTPPS